MTQAEILKELDDEFPGVKYLYKRDIAKYLEEPLTNTYHTMTAKGFPLEPRFEGRMELRTLKTNFAAWWVRKHAEMDRRMAT